MNDLIQKEECKSTAQTGNVNEENIVDRMLKTMRYYESLDMNNYTDQQNITIYLKHTHQSFLNDYIAILTKSYLFSSLKSRISHKLCTFMDCTHCKHFYRDRCSTEERSDDMEYNFIRDMMDSCHCYLYHLHDVGLRVKIDINDLKPENEHEQHQQYFDFIFSIMVKEIQRKRIELQKLTVDGSDFYRFRHNKFRICEQINLNGNDFTFIDALYEYIRIKIPNTFAESVIKTLLYQEYDSDAVEQDISRCDNIHKSNIGVLLHTCSNDSFDAVKQYTRQCQSLIERSFQIGYRFYYWIYYHKPQKSVDFVQQCHNINDHSGYSPHQLYISQKYPSLKYEILNNKLCSLGVYQYTESKKKSEKYLETCKVKKIQALHGGKRGMDVLHFDIPKDSSISEQHLLSIILYTHWNDLCTAFSKTFRQQHKYEPIDIVKDRNREYAIWSRLLRETVEYFGNLGDDERFSENRRKKHTFESGPFFCGIGHVMVIPQFNIRLCSPTSTTKQQEVATRFAGDDGIII
eukprot:59253_1